MLKFCYNVLFMNIEFRQLMAELYRITADADELALQDSLLQDAISDGETFSSLNVDPNTIVGKIARTELVFETGRLALEYVVFNEAAGLTHPNNVWRGKDEGVLVGEFRARGGTICDSDWSEEDDGFFHIDAGIYAYSDTSVENFSVFEGPFDEPQTRAVRFRQEVASYLSGLHFPVDFVAELKNMESDYYESTDYIEPEAVVYLAEELGKI